MERIFVALNARDRQEVFEVTRDVEETVTQLSTPGVPPALLHAMEEAAITRAARQILRAQSTRSDIHSFVGEWSVGRVLASSIPVFRFPSLAETSQ